MALANIADEVALTGVQFRYLEAGDDNAHGSGVGSQGSLLKAGYGKDY
jgi:hypothetical protein